MLSVIVLAFQAAICHFSSASFCPEIKPVKNGNFETEDIPPYKDGAEILIKCDRGYKGYGKMNITCRNGRWSDPVPYCAGVTSTTSPKTTTPTTYLSTTTKVTTTSCEDQNTTCRFWARIGECSKNPSYMKMYCKRSCNECPATRRPRPRGACIPLTSNLGVDITCTDGSNHYSTCTAICREGFTAVEGSSTRVCRNGRWSGVDIKCKPTRRPRPRRTCTPLTRDLGVEITCTMGSNHYSICTATCREGFTAVEGSSTIGRKLCRYGRWIGNEIECKAPSPGFPIQIGNIEMKKWESSGRTEGNSVPVVNNDTGRHVWLLERKEHEFLWSFYVMREEKKLYLTYNDADPNDQDVRMNFDSGIDQNKEKYFTILETVKGKTHLLVSRSSRSRFLGLKDGILTMVHEQELTKYMEWKLAINLQNPSVKRHGEITDYHSPTSHWVSSDSHVLERIQMTDKEKQNWTVIYTGDTKCRLQTNADGKKNFAGQDPDTEADIIFTSPALSKSNTTEYKKVHSRRVTPGGFYLQNQSSFWFVGVEKEKGMRRLLQMKQKDSHATVWTFSVGHFVFLESDGKEITFPPIP